MLSQSHLAPREKYQRVYSRVGETQSRDHHVENVETRAESDPLYNVISYRLISYLRVSKSNKPLTNQIKPARNVKPKFDEGKCYLDNGWLRGRDVVANLWVRAESNRKSWRVADQS